MLPKPTPVHRLVRINYTIRSVSFAWSFVVAAIYGWEHEFGLLFWALLLPQFLVNPHFAYLRARTASDPKAAELSSLYVDAAMLGVWIAGFGFPTWPAYSALQATALNAIVLRSLRGFAFSLAAFALGALAWVALFGVDYTPETSFLVTALCFTGSILYTCAIGYVEFLQNRRLVAAREALRESETRYRLITENAADLVAMVDPGSRWLYGSPSYERILGEGAVSLGTDAFARAVPDDAELGRGTVRRVSLTGKPRELTLRFVDREGRVRPLRMRVQPVDGEAASPDAPHHRLLLVAQDVTDLKESEERLLVAAHALEGLTEAIVITAADGTIVTVNHAFTQLSGYGREEVLGRSVKEMRNGLQPAEFYDEMFLSVLRKGFWTGTLWAKRKNGSVYREWRSVRAVKDLNGAVSHYVMVFFEVNAPGQGDAADSAG